MREDVTAPIDQKIDQLTNLAKSDPKLQDYVKNVFQKIIDYGRQAIGQKQEGMNENPQLASVDQYADFTKFIMDQMAKDLGLKTGDPKVSKALEKSINDIKAYQAKEKAQSYEKGKVAQQTQSEQNKLEIQKLISQLVAKFSPQESQDETRLETIRSFFTANKINDEDTKKFLKLAINGKVIDMNSLVTAGSGKISNHVNPSAKSVYDKIYKNFMFLQPAKATGRGNLGSGEIFFVLLGSPAEKGGKGDLTVTINGKEKKLEVKASRKAGIKKSGGRLDGGAPAAKDTKDQWNQLLQKYFRISNFNEIDYNITEKTLKFINNIIVKNKIKRDKVVNFVTDMLKLFSNQPFNYEYTADTMVNKDGTLDTSFTRKKDKDNKFMRGIALANYASYQQADKFDNLLMLNIDSQDYEIIKSYDEFKNSLAKGDTVITGGITFSDPSNKTALQIYTTSK
jgi:hypothetical protein